MINTVHNGVTGNGYCTSETILPFILIFTVWLLLFMMMKDIYFCSQNGKKLLQFFIRPVKRPESQCFAWTMIFVRQTQ